MILINSCNVNERFSYFKISRTSTAEIKTNDINILAIHLSLKMTIYPQLRVKTESDPGFCIPSKCGHRNPDISKIFL